VDGVIIWKLSGNLSYYILEPRTYLAWIFYMTLDIFIFAAVFPNKKRPCLDCPWKSGIYSNNKRGKKIIVF